MNWAQLGQEIAKLGLPILGAVLPIPGGAALGAALASAIGKPNATPQDVLTALTSDSAALEKAKEFEAQSQQTLLKTNMDYEVAMAKQQNDINAVEAQSQDLFKSGWRPGAGWVCVGGLFYEFIFKPIVTGIVLGAGYEAHFPELDIGTLMTLLAGLLGLGTLRSVDKAKGVA